MPGSIEICGTLDPSPKGSESRFGVGLRICMSGRCCNAPRPGATLCVPRGRGFKSEHGCGGSAPRFESQFHNLITVGASTSTHVHFLMCMTGKIL